MSDGLSQTGGTPRILQQAQPRGEQVVRLITLPQALQDNARGQRLEGEVLKQNNDGTIRISTPQGDVDVEVKGRQPQPGQRLEVDVPAGRPPRQAVIRQAPQQQKPSQNIEEQPVQSQITRTQSRADIAARNVQSDQTRELIETVQRPVQSQNASGQKAAAAKTRPATITQQPLPQQVTAQPQNTAAPLPQGTTVRLTPVSPAQVQQFITQFTQSAQITQAVVQNAAFQATLSTQNVLSQNTQTLLTTVTTAQSAQPIQTQPIQQNPVQTLLSSLLKPLPQSSGQQAGGSVPPSQSPLFERLTQTAPQFLASNAKPELQAALRSTIQILPASTAPLQQPQNVNSLIQNGAFFLRPSFPVNGQAAQGITTPQPVQLSGTPAPFLNPVDVKVQGIFQNFQNILVPANPAEELTAGKLQNLRPLPLPAQITLPKAIGTPTGQAGQIIGQVTAFTPQNLPVVSFQLPGQNLPQSFILQYQPAGVMIGSQIIIQPNALSPQMPGQLPPLPGQALPTSTLLQIPPTLLAFGDQYSPLLLQESYQALLQAAPALAGTLAQSLPSPTNPTQLGAAALLFLTAVRAGDLGSWLGDKKIDALSRSDRTNLLSRLTGSDGSPAPRASLDVSLPSGEWRAVPLPMFWDGDIRQVNLFVRKDGESTGGEDQERTQQTRFIFDLNMSRMGDVQIDGLMREDRLDMVVRTQNPLSSPMQQMLKQVYTKALESESLRGELGFQGDPRQWVNILKSKQAFGAEA